MIRATTPGLKYVKAPPRPWIEMGFTNLAFASVYTIPGITKT